MKGRKTNQVFAEFLCQGWVEQQWSMVFGSYQQCRDFRVREENEHHDTCGCIIISNKRGGSEFDGYVCNVKASNKLAKG